MSMSEQQWLSYTQPWSGVQASRVKELHTKGRKLISGASLEPLSLDLLLWDKLPLLIAHSKEYSGKQRALVLSLGRSSIPAATKAYLYVALLSPEIGFELARIIWDILGYSNKIKLARHASRYSPLHGEDIFLHALFIPLLPPSFHPQENKDSLERLRKESKEYSIKLYDSPSNVHQGIWGEFHSKRYLSGVTFEVTMDLLEKFSPMDHHERDKAATTLINDPIYADTLVKNCLTLDTETFKAFLSMVDEYNLEWALAAFDWGVK